MFDGDGWASMMKTIYIDCYDVSIKRSGRI